MVHINLLTKTNRVGSIKRLGCFSEAGKSQMEVQKCSKCKFFIIKIYILSLKDWPG